jgi:hypothetical protein
MPDCDKEAGYQPAHRYCVMLYFLIHLVGGGNHLGVGFVGSLAHDQIHELIDHADVSCSV